MNKKYTVVDLFSGCGRFSQRSVYGLPLNFQKAHNHLGIMLNSKIVKNY